MTTAYCVKCRTKREIKDPQETTLKNGRPAMKGTCPECGTNMFRIGKPYIFYFYLNPYRGNYSFCFHGQVKL